MQKKIAIVLGGTVPHISLIKKLKERGYYIILVDFLKYPPAKEYADEHIKESTLDQDVVYQIAKARNASLVISTCIDQANSVCCYVSEKLGLSHPYSYETSILVTDKGKMKTVMKANEIPTSDFAVAQNVDDIDWKKVEFPAVVKPVDCNSSKGVRRVECVDEAKRHFEEALNLSRSKTAIIETFNQGSEIQVDCVSMASGVEIMMTRQKQKINSFGDTLVLQSYGSIFPAQLNDEQYRQVQDISKKIASAFQLNNTPFFFQAIVTSKGIQVIELAPRVGGGLSYYALKEFGNYDALDCAIDSFLGKALNVSSSTLKKVYSTNIIYVNPGNFDHVIGLEELKSEGIIKDYFILKRKGALIDGDMRSSNRVAAFVIEGLNYEEIQEKARYAFNNIDVFDGNNNSLMNKAFYSF